MSNVNSRLQRETYGKKLAAFCEGVDWYAEQIAAMEELNKAAASKPEGRLERMLAARARLDRAKAECNKRINTFEALG